MDVEGKPPKRYHVLVMRETSSKMASWLCTDDITATALPDAIGRWIIGSLQRFRLQCFAAGKTPDIKFAPLIMNEQAMAALELDTWRSELGEMMKDVERSSQG